MRQPLGVASHPHHQVFFGAGTRAPPLIWRSWPASSGCGAVCGSADFCWTRLVALTREKRSVNWRTICMAAPSWTGRHRRGGELVRLKQPPRTRDTENSYRVKGKP
ncbi:hypothetical protein Mpe_A3795 [Methylibium petroleiphilum PM1]|uniref:Uncharacterized protein n=1 Tax=Methylibium petroleiphilum (strain ATCC BAA-1232 / LMG 22953 / PM1) TaxID=420662 RepID=A2SMF9_METPP|nr:hypothetical protein Mpe_A3795 [Methylibium petroleiphilum PM1]